MKAFGGMEKSLVYIYVHSFYPYEAEFPLSIGSCGSPDPDPF